MTKKAVATGKQKPSTGEALQISNTCVNCEKPLALDQRYCSNCGGKRIYNRLTWRNLFEDFVDRFLNLENSFLKTFFALFTKPEDVICGYMRGMRKKYLPAFSYFAIAITISGFYSFVLQGWFMDDYISAQTSMYEGDLAEVQREFTTSWISMIMEYQSVVMFLTIPVMALVSKLIFWNYPKCNLVEHFVIYLYAYSHISMVSVFVQLATIWNATLMQVASLIITLLMFVYAAFVLKRVFGLDAFGIIVKSAMFVGVAVILFTIPVMSMGAYYGVTAASGKSVDTTNALGKMIYKQVEIQEAKRKQKKDSLQARENQRTLLDSLPAN